MGVLASLQKIWSRYLAAVFDQKTRRDGSMCPALRRALQWWCEARARWVVFCVSLSCAVVVQVLQLQLAELQEWGEPDERCVLAFVAFVIRACVAQAGTLIL